MKKPPDLLSFHLVSFKDHMYDLSTKGGRNVHFNRREGTQED